MFIHASGLLFGCFCSSTFYNKNEVKRRGMLDFAEIENDQANNCWLSSRVGDWNNGINVYEYKRKQCSYVVT